MRFAAIALISPLYVEEGEILDSENRRVATIFEVSDPQELQQLQPANAQAENVVIDLLDWQVCLLLIAHDNPYLESLFLYSWIGLDDEVQRENNVVYAVV